MKPGDTVPDLTFQTADGTPVLLSGLFTSEHLLLLFMRHLAWIACVAHLGEVERDLDRFRSAGCGLAVVGQAKPAVLASFLKRYPKPYPVVSDPDRSAYRAFGLERTSWPTIFRPDVTLKYLWRMVTGTRPRIPYRGEDVLQLGGDFVLSRDRKVVLAYASRNPTDRPSVARLLAAI